MIAPPAADEEPERQEVPGDDRPAARERDPAVADAAGDEGRDREGERHREAGEAQVERDGMRDHPAVLEQRVEPAPVRRHRGEPLERRRGDRHDEQEECEHAQHDREHPGIELARVVAVPQDDDQRVERQHPRPQDDGALERAPHRGDPIVERRLEVRVDRDVAHREVERQERIDEQEEGGRHQAEHAERGVLRRLDERGSSRARACGRGRRAVQSQ